MSGYVDEMRLPLPDPRDALTLGLRGAALAEGLATRIKMTVIAQRTELIAWYERRGYRRTGAREPFPYGDPRFGLPRRPDLYFEVLEKQLASRRSG